MPRHALVLRLLLILLALGFAGAVRAAGSVELVVPDELRPLLVKHLDFLDRRTDEIDAAGRVALLRRARKEVEEILATEGYFSASIEGDEADDDFRIVVTPGVRSTISSVRLDFAGDLSRDEGDRPARLAALREAWGLPVGQPFRQADWDAAKQRVLDALGAREYAAAAITDSEALIDPATASAALSVTVDSGPVFRFGPLEITGLVDYDRSLIERYRPPTPGEPYSQERLLAARDLYEFDNVFTAPLHGFKDTDDYWQRGSAQPHLHRIRIPALVLNAHNDPFVPWQHLPRAHDVGPCVTLWQPAHGGHVGFAGGRFPGQVLALPQAVMGWMRGAAPPAAISGTMPTHG